MTDSSDPSQNSSVNKTIIIVLSCITVAAAVAATATGVAGSVRKDASLKCSGMKVVLRDSAVNRFLTPADIAGIIDRDFGGYLNRPVERIRTDRIEKVLAAQECLTEYNAYFTSDGVLHIEAEQRSPAIRLTDSTSLWYADIDGRCFKVKEDWKPSLPCILVRRPAKDKRWIRNAAGMGKWIVEHPGWKDSVSGIEADTDGNITVFLTEREESFILGQPEETGVKFGKIGKYLDRIADRGKEYNSVNVSYKGQIICK